MSASSIGPFPFIRISEFPLPPQEQMELESRAGRHGMAAWLTGFKGQPFAVESIADTINGVAAANAITNYTALVGANPQTVVYGGVTLPYQVLVKGIEPLEVTQTILGVGGLLGLSQGLVIARWRLIAWVML